MDTHIKGPRGGQGVGAVPSTVVKRVAFGDAAIAAKEILRTLGALPANPLLLKIYLNVPTAFDGTGPVLKVTEQNLDGSGGVDLIGLGDLSSGRATIFKGLTTDKKYLLTYTVGTAGPTAGLGFVAIELVGPGILPP